MKYSIITADYDYDNNDINLYCRDENNIKCTKKVRGFEPYGYAPLDLKDDLYTNYHIKEVKEIPTLHYKTR